MITAIVCAAGAGQRAGFEENKLLCPYLGMPVLCRTLSVFASIPEIDEILVTVSPRDEEKIKALLSPYPTAKCVMGGRSRFESVLKALRIARGEIVLVHDGARPFVTQKTVRDCIDSVLRFGSGVCALPSTDTVVLCEEGAIRSVPSRDGVYTVQTPQGFYTEKLLHAYESAYKAGETYTDESGVYLAYEEPPRLFLGERENTKLTYREDFKGGEHVGLGIDTHAFGAQSDHIVLAGIRIPSKSGLVAHSDGDVLIHALMDSLLSAAGLRDIGYYFPDTDNAFLGADSTKLLYRVFELVAEQGYKPQNVSISILAETPRLSPYIEEMKQSLSKLLSLPVKNIGIAAGTNEKLGYVGEGKGITVYAATLLESIK